MERIFVDTSAWYALADRSDPDHAAATAYLTSGTLPLLTSNFVFDESVTLVRYRLGHAAACRFGESLRSSQRTTLTTVTGADEEAAWRLFCRARDRKWSFTDCTSFALMRRLKLQTAFAVDDDFAQAGFVVVPAP